MRDDPELIHAVIHSLNEWMLRGRGRSTTRTGSSRRRSSRCRSSTRPSRSSSGCVERGAKTVLIRPAPVPGLPRLALVRLRRSSIRSGRRSSTPTSSCRCTPPTAATPRYQTDWTGPQEMLPFRPDAFRMMTLGQAADRGHRVAAFVCHGVLARFPDLRGRVGRERRRLGRAVPRAPRRHLPEDAARPSTRTRSRRSSATSGCSPFHEDDIDDAHRRDRRRPRPVRLRLPASRGPGRAAAATSTTCPGPGRRRRRKHHGRQPGRGRADPVGAPAA